MRPILLAAGAAAILILTGCDRPTPVLGPEDASPDTGPDVVVLLPKKGGTAQLKETAAAIDAEMVAIMAGVNESLAAGGEEYRVTQAEWITADMAGRSVLFRDRGNKQVIFHFVPGDARRLWSGSPDGPGDDITWAVDETGDAVPLLGGLTAAETDAAITRAMATWDSQNCSNLPLYRNPTFGLDVGVLAGSPFIFADVQHAGFTDLNFFGDILGVTFTFAFVDARGGYTDIDNNGKIDAAFREIYYDPDWDWALDGDFPNIDLETIAVHEMGHGLSQDHFGQLFMTEKNGKFHFAPRSLMNAGYTGVQRGLSGSDRGGHCSIWASWPNN
ncbi:MAG: hypothetical protein HKO65_06260 [Gemmatimonadetes bacterium]|nr:hypothetical protein [Gemmatimonadota bacterium]NNM04690.1 hypothetical protein [Gemmatimonadota bacterium]